MILTSQTYKKPMGISPKGDSLTIPDMSYTIREILDKFTTLPSDIAQQEAIYEENPSFDDAQSFDTDLTDITLNKLKIEHLEQELKNKKSEFKKQKLKEAEKLKEAQSQNSDEGTRPKGGTTAVSDPAVE